MSITTTPNIISGHVTNRANSQRRTPNWLKAVYAVVAGLIVIVGLSLVLAPDSSADHSKSTIPACAEEDGSGQAVCDWNDKSGDHVVNFGNGRYQYNITQNTMHDWTNE